MTNTLETIEPAKQMADDQDDGLDATERERRARVVGFMRQVGPKYRKARFVNYECSSDKQTQVRDFVRKWAATYPKHPSAGLILFGTCGTGKDYLAIAATNMIVHQQNVTAGFVNGESFRSMTRDGITNEQTEREILAPLLSPSILIISDPTPAIGTLTAHQASRLYALADCRSSANKATILTINCRDAEHAAEMMGGSTLDRFRDGAWVARCAWPSHRQPAEKLFC